MPDPVTAQAADPDAPAMPADIAAFVERMYRCCATLVTIGLPDALAAAGALSAYMNMSMPRAKESDGIWCDARVRLSSER